MKTPKPLNLTPQEANAILVMLESDLETWLPDFDPIADWETLHLNAHMLLAYYAFKTWYVETHDETRVAGNLERGSNNAKVYR